MIIRATQTRRLIAARFTGLLVVLLISGCAMTSVDLEMTFYEGEGYQVDMLFDVPQEALAWTPGGRAGLEQEIENLIAKSRAEGFQASWMAKEDAESGLLTYVVTMQGEGFDTLVEGGNWRVAPITYQGQQAIEVQISPQPLAAWGVGLRSLTLHGSDILESNGTEVERGVAKWHNLSNGAYAVLVPKDGTNQRLLLLLALVIGGGIAALAAAGVRGHAGRRGGRRERAQEASPVAPGGTRVCPNCGTEVAKGARFCTRCGRRLFEP